MFKQAALAGLRLIGRAPVAFLVWVGLRLVEQYVTLAVLLAALLSKAMPGVGAVWAVLLGLPFEAVLIAALLRAELKPRAGELGFLRLGHTEFRMAGLLLIAGLVAAVIAVPSSIGVAYLGYALQQRALAGASLAIGAVVAILALLRLAPMPAILVDNGKLDPGLAWRASRGRYVLLAVLVIAAMAVDRASGLVITGLGAPPQLVSWAALASPIRLVGMAWRSLIGVGALAVMTGAIAVVWRDAKQTLD
ncbi:MAG: hypothetical protein WDN45_08925 [Caulobacteraceae bacterium]